MAVVSFDDAKNTFTFYYKQDLSLVSDIPVAILITGTAGTIAPISADAAPPLLLTIKNPCINPDFIEFVPSVVENQIYRIDRPAITFTFTSAELKTYPFDQTLCGELAYDVWYVDADAGAGAYVDTTSSPLSFDSTTLELSFVTSDTSMIKEHQYIIEIYLADYPTDLYDDSTVGKISVEE